MNKKDPIKHLSDQSCKSTLHCTGKIVSHGNEPVGTSVNIPSNWIMQLGYVTGTCNWVMQSGHDISSCSRVMYLGHVIGSIIG